MLYNLSMVKILSKSTTQVKVNTLSVFGDGDGGSWSKLSTPTKLKIHSGIRGFISRVKSNVCRRIINITSRHKIRPACTSIG